MRKDNQHWVMINQRWRNDVGRRLADLEIVLGTHRKEMQVREAKVTLLTSIQVEGLTLEQEVELMKQDRGKDFASMTERLGRLEELAR